MKETVHFTKMQGAGNDYIYVDTQQYDIPAQRRRPLPGVLITRA